VTEKKGQITFCRITMVRCAYWRRMYKHYR